MASTKTIDAQTEPATTQQRISAPQPSIVATSPEELKERFAPQRIPLASDFANLIDMADAGCRAAGQASNQDGNAGAGLALEDGRLMVNTGDGLAVTASQLHVQATSNGAISVGSDGIAVNIGAGLEIVDNQLRNSVSISWVKILGEVYGATYYAIGSYFTAFAMRGNTSYPWTVIVLPRNGLLPYLSASSYGSIGGTRLDTYTGIPPVRSNTDTNEKIVSYIVFSGVIESGTSIILSAQTSNYATYTSATFTALSSL